jgi:hypothetical protein
MRQTNGRVTLITRRDRAAKCTISPHSSSEVYMNVRLIVLGAALAGTALTTVASAQQYPQQQPYAVNAQHHLRGDRNSDQNIRREYRRLEQVIDGLQRDQRDYGGHRAQAIQNLQQARQQLDEALEYDRTHGPGR